MKLGLTFWFLIALSGCGWFPPSLPTTPVPIPKEENTLTWDRNADVTTDYVVYACWIKACLVPKQAIGTVRQPATGKPEYKVYLQGKAGAFAVTARDQAGHESGQSNIVRFDRR